MYMKHIQHVLFDRSTNIYVAVRYVRRIKNNLCSQMFLIKVETVNFATIQSENQFSHKRKLLSFMFTFAVLSLSIESTETNVFRHLAALFRQGASHLGY